jgi:serine/threonine protein kinase
LAEAGLAMPEQPERRGGAPLPQGSEQPTLDVPPAAADPPTLAPDQSPTPPTAAEGETFEMARPFGDYELLGEIARGGMGVVYRARERYSGRLVALKMMLGESAHGPSDLRRFVLEAQATGQLNHPGIVAIHAWNEHEGHPFYTMDFVPGVPLSQLVQQGPFPVERAVRYLIGIARAVAAAHALGIVHRDLKPSNVIIDPSDQPRVLDFGLAKRRRAVELAARAEEELEALPADVRQALPAAVLEALGPGTVDALPADASVSVRPADGPRCSPATERGAILGTPSYMAPEQARGEHDQVGLPADVHALGAIFYEMLTGRPPYQAGKVIDTLVQVMEREPEPVRRLRSRVPPAIEAVCLRCLRKRAGERYPDAGVLADDLQERWHRAVHGPRFARLTLAALVAALVLLLVRHAAVEWGGMGLETPARVAQTLTTASGPSVGMTGALLVATLGTLFLAVGPAVAVVATLAWLAAWVWHSGWPWLICVVFSGAAAVAWVVCLAAAIAGGPPMLFIAVGSLLTVAALVSACVSAYRVGRHFARGDVEPAASDGEPFLQKLFAGRVGGRPKAAAGSAARAPGGLADFEVLKRLHGWEGGSVHRGRQKSLDRPVLMWLDAQSTAAGAPLPGVVVRHPVVPCLHAVVSCAEGRFLVTEHVAAGPLAERLERSGLLPLEAVDLVARLAHAIQAFHDQGACHGRLRPEWVLIHGDLEPVLCPCGIPSQADAERAEDVRALAHLLLGWLPPRAGRWQRRPLAMAYRVCDTALEGGYARAADLAADLERAARWARIRWRERGVSAVVVLLAIVPLLVLVLDLVLSLFVSDANKGPDVPSLADPVAPYLLLGLCPAAVVLGYAQGRTLVYRFRLRLRGGGHDPFLRRGLVKALGEIALLAVPAEIFLIYGLHRSTVTGVGLLTHFLVFWELLGFWFAGVFLAAIVTSAEWVLATVRPQP